MHEKGIVICLFANRRLIIALFAVGTFDLTNAINETQTEGTLIRKITEKFTYVQAF